MAITQTSLSTSISAGQAGHIAASNAVQAAVNDLTTVFNGWQSSDRGVKQGAIVVSVLDKGASTGASAATNTAAFNTAIVAAVGGTVLVPGPGTYAIDPNASTGSAVGAGILLNQAGTKLLLTDGAVLQASTSTFNSYAIIRVSAADCVIEGGTIIGDLATHGATGGEWGHGIDIQAGANRLRVVGTKISNCWGDGIYLYGDAEDVHIGQVVSTYNRRQGLTIAKAIRPRVIGGTYAHTGRVASTSPAAGIDIEPSGADAVVDAIVTGATLADNVGPGFTTVGTNVTATVTGCHATGNDSFGFNAGSATIKFIGCTASGHAQPGFNTTSAATPLVELIGCTARDGTGSSARGFFMSGKATLVGCYAINNGGAGFYLQTTGGSNLIGCVAVGNSTGATVPQFDIYSTSLSVLQACNADRGAGAASHGYVARTGCVAKLLNCTATGSYSSATYTDQVGTTVAFPKPGVTIPASITGTLSDGAALASALTALASLGLVTDSSTAGIPATTYVVGRYYGAVPAATTTRLTVTGTRYAIPFFARRAITIDRIGAEVTGAGAASSTVRLGIYADSGGFPSGSPILDAGTIAGDSVTAQEITVSQALPAGLYWLACQAESAGTYPTMRAISGPQAPIGTTTLASGTSVAGGGYAPAGAGTGPFGTYPATPVTISSAPSITVRIA